MKKFVLGAENVKVPEDTLWIWFRGEFESFSRNNDHTSLGYGIGLARLIGNAY